MSEVTEHAPSIEPPMVLTKAAEAHLFVYLNKNPNSKGICFSVKKTGCSGLSYVTNYIDALNPDDITLPFGDDYVISIDRKSYPFLKGTIVDYIKQGLDYQLVFRNPNQTGQCGCGESFTVN
ncbi:MAG: iron-sulfur cluster assembly accessory protein [Legionella sp.]|nr:iron-sulfur cluster assembly accessory protein [Legionella sp.]